MPDVTLKVETSPTWKEILVQALCCCARWILRGFLLFIGFYLASLWLPISAKAAEVTIPRAAQQYRATLVRAAHATWGLDAPVAVFAAQVHTESWWRNDTVSHVGAQGLAQFMPATARWLPSVAPKQASPRRSIPAGACGRSVFTTNGYGIVSLVIPTLNAWPLPCPRTTAGWAG